MTLHLVHFPVMEMFTLVCSIYFFEGCPVLACSCVSSHWVVILVPFMHTCSTDGLMHKSVSCVSFKAAHWLWRSCDSCCIDR